MLHGKTRLIKSSTSTGGKTYHRFIVHIPSKIANDSQFPFKGGQQLTITVEPKGKIVLTMS